MMWRKEEERESEAVEKALPWVSIVLKVATQFQAILRTMHANNIWHVT